MLAIHKENMAKYNLGRAAQWVEVLQLESEGSGLNCH